MNSVKVLIHFDAHDVTVDSKFSIDNAGYGCTQVYLHNLMENFQLRLGKWKIGWNEPAIKQAIKDDEKEKYQMQTQMYDVIVFFKFICGAIRLQRTILLFHSYGNVINKNTALPMRHTNNNKHNSFLSCSQPFVLMASCMVSFYYALLRGALSVHTVCTPLCFAHLISSYFHPNFPNTPVKSIAIVCFYIR